MLMQQIQKEKRKNPSSPKNTGGNEEKRSTKPMRGKEGEERGGGENQQAIISLIWSPY